MAFNNAFTAVTGATYTAAQYNTYTRDNLTAIWVYTTAGDIVYATSATALARLGIGVAYQHQRVNAAGNAPEWAALMHRRQGGSSSDWNSQGSNNYTPASALIQTGIINVTITASTYGVVTVTFPVAFSDKPAILTAMDGSGADIDTTVHSRGYPLNASSAKISLHSYISGTTTFAVRWLAIGPP